jgi:hypothetical protein
VEKDLNQYGETIGGIKGEEEETKATEGDASEYVDVEVIDLTKAAE